MTDKLSTSEAPAIPAKEPTPNELMILIIELVNGQLQIAAEALQSQVKLNSLVIEKLKHKL